MENSISPLAPMSDFRVFAPSSAVGIITLSAGESHHLVNVNRARAGDTVIAFDGRGTEWTCELTDARKTGANLRITSTRTLAPLPCAITLAQALPKGGVMDDIIRHATELGTARIVPIASERTQVHLDGDRSDKKVDKWRTAALEAAKQCGNPFLPEITRVQSFAAFLETGIVKNAQLKLIASLNPGARPLREVINHRRAQLGQPLQTAIWLVGPEGDFSPSETAASETAGFIPVTLGSLVLRCDTAATAALSILNYEAQ
jgi:16S rRNA (uracil1498-N3)-methyltransferase